MLPRNRTYYVYVLQSLKNQPLYIGSTSNLKRRIQQHNNGNPRYTNQYRPSLKPPFTCDKI
ncbi:GIY-YIG nuclease family protein [Patescibacteria group bacterium]|nr:GIY-YIG nuclease family protein [Patescibacteria group bacterium]MBU1868339.1 GIY-YIG nuclease family protein [Patescibacteria group bacterium]